VDDEVTALMPGGELELRFVGGTVLMTGPVEEVCEGNFSPRLLERIGAVVPARLGGPSRGRSAASPGPSILRSTRLEVDLDALSHNLRAVRGHMADTAPTAVPQAGIAGGATRIAAVLKANAYGMGAVQAAREFVRAGADMLAVATLSEAAELERGLGSTLPVPVLVMGHTPDSLLAEAARRKIELAIGDLRQAGLLSRHALEAGRTCSVHIKVDTGMNRLGMVPDSGAPALLSEIADLPGIRIAGIFSHLALRSADSDRRQFGLFMDLIASAEARGLSFPLRHLCDSIGLVRYPEYRLDMVRVGAALYGMRPLNDPAGAALDLRTPLALRTRVSRVKAIAEGEGVSYDASYAAPAGGALIATLPVGYADGYPRRLSNVAEVLIRGRRAPVVGLICMDQLFVDVSGVPDAAEDDEVLLLGASGGEELGVLEVAGWSGTNRNEVIASIGRRVPRVYLRGGREVGSLDYLACREDCNE
jgi:alanine racemase